jgi:hypothetical protein
MPKMSLSLHLQLMVLSALFNQRRVPENHSIPFNGRVLPLLEAGWKESTHFATPEIFSDHESENRTKHFQMKGISRLQLTN